MGLLGTLLLVILLNMSVGFVIVVGNGTLARHCRRYVEDLIGIKYLSGM